MAIERKIPRGAIRIAMADVCQQRDYTCGAAAVLAVARHLRRGPSDEQTVVADMRMGRDGSDPVHLRRALRRYGIVHTEQRGMSDALLRAYVDRGCPVIVMLQAWGRRRRYVGHWRDGHWVVVVGHDAGGVYVEDPMLAGVRGFLTWPQLADRWHDVDDHTGRKIHRYGLAVCHGPRRPSAACASRFVVLG